MANKLTAQQWLAPMTPTEVRILATWQRLLGFNPSEPIHLVSTEECAVQCVILFLRWAVDDG